MSGHTMKSGTLTPLTHHGPVTAIRFISNLILIGNGPILKIYDTKTSQEIFNKQMFSRNKIHNISYTGDSVVLSGGRSFLVTKLSKLISFKGTYQYNLDDFKEKSINEWIVTSEFLNETQLLILTAHNIIYSIKLTEDFEKLSLSEKFNCGELSILYSGSIKIISPNQIYIAAGTVMDGILIWDLYSGKIIHNLLGHEGSIFNVKISNTGDRIISCSDDRSIKVWDMSSGENLATGWGHTSRIWNLEFINENLLMSCSEDCSTRIWQYDNTTGEELKLLDVWEPHLGKHVWCGDYNEDLGLVVTGGADGRIRLHDLSPLLLSSNSTNKTISYTADQITKDTQVKLDKNEIIKQFVEIESGLIILTSQGKVFLFQEFTRWIFLFQDSKFSNFGYCNGFFKQDIIILSSRTGDLLLLKFKKGELITRNEILESHLNGKNITNILTYESNNKLYIFTDSPNPKVPFLLRQISNDLQVLQTIKLTKPNQAFISTCFEIDPVNNWVLIGSRYVSFCLYDLNNLAEDVCDLTSIYKKLSAGDTITSIKIIKSTKGEVNGIVTVRDGVYFYFQIQRINEEYKLSIIHQNKLSRGFLEGSILNNDNELVLYGFKSSFFYIWNETKQIEIMNEMCGGSHRQWDFNYYFNNSRNLQTKFQYIKNSDFYYNKFQCRFSSSDYGVINNGTHGREIRDVTISPDNYDANSKLIMTASEDATVRLSKLYNDGSIENYWPIRTHVSGLQKIKFISNEYVASSAAREEFYIWKISNLNSDSKKIPLIREFGNLKPTIANPDLRIMDFDTLEIYSSGELVGFLIVTCYSNSDIKVWFFEIANSTFTLIISDSYTTCCLLNVNFLVNSAGEIYLMTGATDGHLSIWNITEDITPNFTIVDSKSLSLKLHKFEPTGGKKLNKLIIKQQLHQSGIKALEITQKGKYETWIVTGGDDNALILSQLKHHDDIMTYELKSFIENAASSTITSISSLSHNKIVVTSVDQIVRVWDTSDGNLVLCDERYTTVADTGCVDTATFVVDGETREVLLVGGAGMSCWSVEA